MTQVVNAIRSDPSYYILLALGLLGIIMGLAFRNTPVEDIGDWLAVFSSTWLIARAYYTE